MGLSCLLTQWYCTKRAKELGLDSYVSSFDHEFYGKWLKRFNKTQPNTPERQALLDERDAKEEADLLANPSFWYGQAGYLIESCDEKYVPEILAAITHAESIRDNKYVQGIAQYFGLSTEKTVKARMAEIPAQRERQAERIREMLIKG